MSANPDEAQRELQAAAAASSDAFVSYSSQDAAVANALVEALETRGIRCWIAPRDVKAGAQYADAIVRAITGAQAFVLVLSEHAMASPHVSREIERASSKRRPIFAVRVDAAALTPAFEYFLSESQWVEAQSGAMEAACGKLIDAIREPQGTAPRNVSALSPEALARASPAADPRSLRKRIVVVTGLAIVAVTFAALYAIRFWHAKHVNAESTPTVSARVANDRSIAVLPFENRSAKENDSFFTNGIHDDILSQLTKIGAMKVIALTSVEQFRNTRLTTREIGRKLGVARVLEGGVQRAGDRVHVTVQLIDVVSDVHLWAESYDRKLTVANVFSIQSEIAAAIAVALRVALTPAEQMRLKAIPAQNLDAWEAYQLGRQRTANRTTAGLAEAEKYFRKTIALDPKYALAYTGLADTLVAQTDYSGAPVEATLAKAEQAVNTALRLDPNLAEAWASLATILEYRGHADRAEATFRRAIALDPNYALAYQHFSTMLIFNGRAEEALSLAARAVELDPLSAMVNSILGLCLEALGRFDEAEASYRKVIEIDPSMPRSYWQLAVFSAYTRNRFADAVLFMEKNMELDPGKGYSLPLAEIYLDLDEAQAAQMIQAARKEVPDDWPTLSSTLYLYQGDQEGALQIAREHLGSDPRNVHALRLLRDANAIKGEDAVARARYAKAYPELFTKEPPKIDGSNSDIVIDLVPILQKTGESARANVLLDRTEKFIRTIPRMGGRGYGIADVEIYALRGQKREALAALRVAEKAGWRKGWHYYRDFDPGLTSIRNEPEFKVVFADIERDMARQRGELAARHKNAPLDLKATAK